MAETTNELQVYETMFANRFTSEDEEYQEYLKRSTDQPPIVEDWRTNQHRNQDRYRDNRHQRSWEGRRDWSHSNSYNQPRGGRGWGNSYNQSRQDRSHYQPEGRYGYNPSNQRFHSDRY
ncbi:RNA guanine-N7 methyltransferase activating subunit [Discoglossus pictus]